MRACVILGRCLASMAMDELHGGLLPCHSGLGANSTSSLGPSAQKSPVGSLRIRTQEIDDLQCNSAKKRHP